GGLAAEEWSVNARRETRQGGLAGVLDRWIAHRRAAVSGEGLERARRRRRVRQRLHLRRASRLAVRAGCPRWQRNRCDCRHPARLRQFHADVERSGSVCRSTGRMAVGIRRLTVAQAVVEFLIAQKSERDGETQPFFAGVFGIFGHGNVAGLGEALLAARDRMRFVLPRNEQAMVHTAAAFAKMRNRLQTYACTTSIGPGATNMITAAAGATINRVP